MFWLGGLFTRIIAGKPKQIHCYKLVVLDSPNVRQDLDQESESGTKRLGTFARASRLEPRKPKKSLKRALTTPLTPRKDASWWLSRVEGAAAWAPERTVRQLQQARAGIDGVLIPSASFKGIYRGCSEGIKTGFHKRDL